MKKILGIILTLVILACLGYFIYTNYFENKIAVKEVETEKVSVNEYYIYGNHLNLKGSLEVTDKNYEDIKLTLYNGEDKDIDIKADVEDNKITFYLSETINEGLYLDNLEKGKYYLFLKLIYKDPEDKEKDISKYYILKNDTEYKDTTYYTLSKYNNKIVVNSNNDYPTMALDITENKNNNDIYDITIDPGHGGMDSGGVSGDYQESELTMEISKKIKINLEKQGLKVKLTREEEKLTTNDVLDEYNKGGRAVISNEVKSKYTFSIHINKNTSKKVHGLEVYTPANVNYDLAKSIAENITTQTELSPSTNRLFKVSDGVYTHNFTDSEIDSSLKGYEDKGYKAYNVTKNSNYLYMIRETGGYMTGAYVDDSNPEKVGVNPYYNSNIGNEAYLLEIGYISNSSDLEIILNSEDKLAKAISDAIIKEIELQV